MRALRDLQASMTAYLVSGEEADILGAVAGDSIPAAARLRIHRHHLYDSLGGALAATFSTVQQLVGGRFFRQMAHAFIAGELPAQPVLSEYGEGFAAFVEGYGPARPLPYLADMARLDWALAAAFHSPARPRLSAADLAAVAAEQLPSRTIKLARGTAVIQSAFPLDRIWAAAQPGASDETVDLGEGRVHLLVFRRPDDAGFVKLEEGEAAFALSLLGGASLETAAAAALAAQPGFDLTAAFRRLFDLEVFAAMQH